MDLIRDDAAKAAIKIHKLRGNVSILEGSGGNIAVLTGSDGKLVVDAGITASRPRLLEVASSLSGDPIKVGSISHNARVVHSPSLRGVLTSFAYLLSGVPRLPASIERQPRKEPAREHASKTSSFGSSGES